MVGLRIFADHDPYNFCKSALHTKRLPNYFESKFVSAIPLPTLQNTIAKTFRESRPRDLLFNCSQLLPRLIQSRTSMFGDHRMEVPKIVSNIKKVWFGDDFVCDGAKNLKKTCPFSPCLSGSFWAKIPFKARIGFDDSYGRGVWGVL